jgi:FkbH-like protein
MSYYVFRNHTIERFLPKEYQFSGYDDISVVPDDVEGYVWFYQIPIKYGQDALIAEIDGYAQKFAFVMSQVPPAKMMVAFTLEWLYAMPLTDNDHRLRMAINSYNRALFELCEQYHNLKVIDFGEFTRHYSTSELIDWKFYFISQMGLNPKLSKAFKAWFSRKMDGIALKRKKCLVLDLDNTLWGGVLGEEGIEGIKIGGDYPGKAFLYFQEVLLELSKSGVILTVCSKNNEQDVLEAWERNPFLVLKKEHFATYHINWTDKVTNIKEIAEELNIGLDSMVFVDDNPTERELVRQLLPMVEVPEFPTQPYELPVFVQKLVEDFFKVYSVTDEDKRKTEQYKANALRAQAQQRFSDLTDFLRSLDIQMTIEQANDFNIPRIAQMTQKTNQFNLTTRRYTETDIRRFLEEGWIIWCLSVADKFGDNGITGCLMVKPIPSPSQKEGSREIDTLLLSCRILGKGIEYAFLKTVLRLLRDSGTDELTASYLPTFKNEQVSDFYEKNGFKIVSAEPEGTKHYVVSLTDTELDIEEYYHITIK